MADFDWEAVPHSKGDFNWDDHAVVDPAPNQAEERPWYDVSAKGLWEGVKSIPKTLDDATGAPVRKFMSEAVTGETLDQAPSGREQAIRMGANDMSYKDSTGIPSMLGGDVSPADIYGTALEFIQDPLVLGSAAVKGAQKGMQALGGVGRKVGQYLGGAAEKLAVNATGATGAQSAKFADDAGRQLLDRGLVKFGDTPENIAERTGQAMSKATGDIDGALKSLEAGGVTASSDNVVAGLRQHIDELKLDPSQAGVVKKLEGIVDSIIETGRSNVPIGQAEKTKRGFNKMAGNWMDPEAGQAGKQAYLSYMDEVERAAQAADPAMANRFQSGKESYGLLAPIQEAAERRAMTQNQSPFGGLGDFAAGGAGGMAAGPGGFLGGVLAKKHVAPRITSSGAVTLDKVSKALMSSPKMKALEMSNPAVYATIVSKMGDRLGAEAPRAAETESRPYDQEALIKKTQGTKYSQTLQDAASRGPNAVGATHFILQSRDPDYRQLTVGDDEQE